MSSHTHFKNDTHISQKKRLESDPSVLLDPIRRSSVKKFRALTSIWVDFHLANCVIVWSLSLKPDLLPIRIPDILTFPNNLTIHSPAHFWKMGYGRHCVCSEFRYFSSHQMGFSISDLWHFPHDIRYLISNYPVYPSYELTIQHTSGWWDGADIYSLKSDTSINTIYLRSALREDGMGQALSLLRILRFFFSSDGIF